MLPNVKLKSSFCSFCERFIFIGCEGDAEEFKSLIGSFSSALKIKALTEKGIGLSSNRTVFLFVASAFVWK
jgi:hypothetical protein